MIPTELYLSVTDSIILKKHFDLIVAKIVENKTLVKRWQPTHTIFTSNNLEFINKLRDTIIEYTKMRYVDGVVHNAIVSKKQREQLGLNNIITFNKKHIT